MKAILTIFLTVCAVYSHGQELTGAHGPANTWEPHWVKIESTNIIYYFQDTARIQKKVERYISDHEAAYVKINEVFQAVLPSKIVFYVWIDRELAKQILHRELGFTLPKTCITHAAIDQTVGHEMTHTLA